MDSTSRAEARRRPSAARNLSDVAFRPPHMDANRLGSPHAAVGVVDVPCPATPRVFGVAATALPLAVVGVPTLPRECEVALRLAPTPGEAFPIRASRGVFAPGMFFALRYPSARGRELALIRALDVTEPKGIGFDIVTASVVGPERPAPERQATRFPIEGWFTARFVDPEETCGEVRGELIDVSESGVAFRCEAPLAIGRRLRIIEASATGLEDAEIIVVRHGGNDPARWAARFVEPGPERVDQLAEPDQPAAGAPSPALEVRGSASAVTVGGVATIDQQLTVTLLTPVGASTLRLTAPRGEIAPGACFAVRYLDRNGARRVLVRALDVRPQPGMRDEITGLRVSDPAPAPERSSYRAPFDRFFTAEIVTRGGRRVTGRLLDVSASGVGFRLTSPMAVGETLRFVDPSPGDLEGAEFRVVRRDPEDPTRFGACFLEEDRGAATLTTVLGLDRDERRRRRLAQLAAAAAAAASGATAAPLQPGDIEMIRARRLYTRHRLRDAADRR